MNESVKFNKSANICFIVAGILFLLHPLFTLILRLEHQIVTRIIFSMGYIFNIGEFFGYGAADQIRNILLFIGLAILCLIFAVGCFVGKKTTIVLAIAAILDLLYYVINTLISFIREISFIIKSIVRHYFRISELFYYILAFIPSILFIISLILFVIVCFTGLKKRPLAIIGSISFILYVISNSIVDIYSLITSLLNTPQYALLSVNELITYLIFDTLVVLPFLLVLLFVKQVKTVE